MFEWMKKYKFILVMSSILLFIFFIIVIPLILNKIYYAKAICDFLIVGYSVDYILGYYGNILTFVGTVSLGIITVYQNYVSQQKTEEINKLQLQIAKRSMALAEQSYQKQIDDEENKSIPKFELKNSSFSVRYSNLNASLKNVSPNVISDLKSVSFEVFNSEKKLLMGSDKVVSKKSFLNSGEETNIEFRNNELSDNTGENTGSHYIFRAWKNVNIIWKFQCDDERSRMHYYEATLNIEDCNKFIEGPWSVIKVG